MSLPDKTNGLPDVRKGQTWADNDKRSKGRVVLVLRDPDLNVPNPAAAPVWVETLSSRDGATGPEDSRTRGRRHTIKLGRFKPTSTGYRLVTGVDLGN